MGTKIINKLTAEQAELIPVVRDDFLRHGLSTEPADFEAAERALKDAYAVAGLPAPEIFIRLASPYEGAIAAAILTNLHLGPDVRSQVRDQVRAQVWAQVRAQVGDQVRDRVRAQVLNQVWAQVEDQVWNQVRFQVGSQVRSQVGAAMYGQHDVSWLSFYDFFARAGLVKETRQLAPLTAVAQSCGWVWMFKGAVVMTDRPRRVAFDAERRLHCETGKAVEYSDGFGISAWHGTRVPDEWLSDRSSLNARIALTWPNIEQRRAACEILGWRAILAELDARRVDKNDDPKIGELIEVDIPGLGRERFLHVLCGTGRKFALRVPPDMQTALQAQAWTWGLDANSFIPPEVRT